MATENHGGFPLFSLDFHHHNKSRSEQFKLMHTCRARIEEPIYWHVRGSCGDEKKMDREPEMV
jgi:hypothetical protein